jgi:hypothetical protein
MTLGESSRDQFGDALAVSCRYLEQAVESTLFETTEEGPMPEDLGTVLKRAGLLAHSGVIEAQELSTPACWLLDRKNLAAACHAAGLTLKQPRDQALTLKPAKGHRRK